jgi:hypothetical protein
MFHTIGRSASPKQELHKGLISIRLAFDNGTSWFVGAGFTLIGFPDTDIDKPALPKCVVYKTN